MAEVFLISDESNDTKSSLDELPDFGITTVSRRSQGKEFTAGNHLLSSEEDDACVDLTQECFNTNPDLHGVGNEADRLSISSRETVPYSDDDAAELVQLPEAFSNLPESQEVQSDLQGAYCRSPNLEIQERGVQHTGTVNEDQGDRIENNVKRGGVKRKSKSGGEGETRREQLERERASRRLAVGQSKHYRPGECMKSMVVEVDSSLGARWYMEEARRELEAAGASLQLGPQPHEGLVTWARRLPATLQVNSGQVRVERAREQCGGALVVLEAAQAASLVVARALASELEPLRRQTPPPLTLVVFGLKDHLRASKGGRGKSRRAKDARPAMSEIEFEMAVTDLMVSLGCGCVRADTSSELALCILHHTKAVAELPHKARRRELEERAAFYMRGDNKNCLPIDKHGGGVERVWQQMLAVLGAASLDTARALVSAHPTPRLLYQACMASEGAGEGAGGLARVGVVRAGDAGARARRLGPELARRIHALFTASDGDALLL